jgi:coatomer subunit beta
MATALSKMVSRFSDTVKDANAVNEIKAEAMLIMTSMIRAGKSKTVQTPIDEDSLERIMLCLRFLSSLPGDADLKNAFLEDSRKAYSESVKLKQVRLC